MLHYHLQFSGCSYVQHKPPTMKNKHIKKGTVSCQLSIVWIQLSAWRHTPRLESTSPNLIIHLSYLSLIVVDHHGQLGSPPLKFRIWYALWNFLSISAVTLSTTAAPKLLSSTAPRHTPLVLSKETEVSTQPHSMTPPSSILPYGLLGDMAPQCITMHKVITQTTTMYVRTNQQLSCMLILSPHLC